MTYTDTMQDRIRRAKLQLGTDYGDEQMMDEAIFREGIKEGLARHEDPLNGPCVFCGYNSIGYWQTGTHSLGCPFRDIGGITDREAQLKEWGIIKDV